MSDPLKITSSHLARAAIVYLRQSSAAQVEHNRESTDRQYALVSKASDLGWPTAQGGLCHEASTRMIARPSRSSATRPYRQVPGWILPPLVNRAVGAHRIRRAKITCTSRLNGNGSVDPRCCGPKRNRLLYQHEEQRRGK